MATTYTNPSSSVDSSTARVLAWCGVALQVVAFIAVWWLQRWNGLWTIGGFFVLSLAFMLLQDRMPSMISFLIVCASLLNAGGWAWNWFHQFRWFDEIVHTFTPFALVSAIMYHLLTNGWVSRPPGTSGFMIMAALIGLGLGMVWELLEASFLNLAWGDTLLDVVMDTIGAAIGGIFAGWVIDRQGAAWTS
jgi:hypothetical protein